MAPRLYAPLAAGCFALFAATSASADCAADLAELQQDAGGAAGAESQGGISKDGSLAPLQTEGEGSAAVTTETAGADSAAPQEADGEAIAKDGTQAPLEGDDASAGAAPAISGQAAQAQQEGLGTEGGTARADAIARAEAALAAGDEEGCMQAVEEARNL